MAEQSVTKVKWQDSIAIRRNHFYADEASNAVTILTSELRRLNNEGCIDERDVVDMQTLITSAADLIGLAKAILNKVTIFPDASAGPPTTNY